MGLILKEGKCLHYFDILRKNRERSAAGLRGRSKNE